MRSATDAVPTPIDRVVNDKHTVEATQSVRRESRAVNDGYSKLDDDGSHARERPAGL
jgi:hypothetical protein